jgi:uncharacterized protein YqjF (DUF2071 family)
LAETLADQLFVHWPVSGTALRDHLPAELEVDERDGSGWLGVTPFSVKGFRLRGTLPIPVVSSFHQLNVRTCVTHDGKPGIWFFSLDSSSTLVVEAARRLYRVPFFRATVKIRSRGERTSYECAREDGRAFSASYVPSGPPATPRPGSLEHFLVERYCLYVEHRGRLCRAEIHHGPWPLQPADAEIELNTMPPDWLRLDDEPLFQYSGRQDVLIWPLEPVAEGDT